MNLKISIYFQEGELDHEKQVYDQAVAAVFDNPKQIVEVLGNLSSDLKSSGNTIVGFSVCMAAVLAS